VRTRLDILNFMEIITLELMNKWDVDGCHSLDNNTQNVRMEIHVIVNDGLDN